MSYITRNNSRDPQVATQKSTQPNAIAQFADNRATTATQLQQQALMAASPGVTAQLMQQQAIQRAAPEEELQMKSATSPAQLESMEEEPLQGKFAPVQRAGDEELLQGKFAPVQRAEDEELLQGKFETAQRLEEEEPLQGKFEPVQRAQKANNTGLPDNLKSGIESLSGISMDNVNVHYNSDKPAQLNAHAYAQGTDIHVAPGQEQHLPHEAWHVVQQAQGRVKPTMQMKAGVPVNDDAGLEHEADVMGARALQSDNNTQITRDIAAPHFQNSSIQRMTIEERDGLKQEDYGKCKSNGSTKTGIYLFTIWHNSDKYYNIQVHWHPGNEYWGVRWANEGSGNNRPALEWMKQLVRATPAAIAVAMASKSGNESGSGNGNEYNVQFPALKK